MNLTITPEQNVLRERLREFLTERYPLTTQVETSQTVPGWRKDIWRAMGQELGLLGLGIPADRGGAGGGPGEIMTVMEELGNNLMPEPYLESVVLAAGALRRLPGTMSSRALQELVRGDAAYAVAWSEAGARESLCHVSTKAKRDAQGWVLDGSKVAVVAAPWCDSMVVSARTSGSINDPDGISLFLVPRGASGVSLESFHTLDGRMAADLVLLGIQLPEDALLGTGSAALSLMERVSDEATTAMCASTVGSMEAMFQLSTAFLKQRRQFGQSLSSFQVLQHRVADMMMDIELARSSVFGAVLHLNDDSDPEERAKAVSAAKVTVDRAARRVGQAAVQLHGGLGMNEATLVTHYFRRVTVSGNRLGTADQHLARFARLESQTAYELLD